MFTKAWCWTYTTLVDPGNCHQDGEQEDAYSHDWQKSGLVLKIKKKQKTLYIPMSLDLILGRELRAMRILRN